MGRLFSTVWFPGRPQQDADTSAFVLLPGELSEMVNDYASGVFEYEILSSMIPLKKLDRNLGYFFSMERCGRG